MHCDTKGVAGGYRLFYGFLMWIVFSIGGSGSSSMAAELVKPVILTKKSCDIQDHYVISLLLGSRKGETLRPKSKKAALTKNQAYVKGAVFRVAAINAAGGLRGKPVCLQAFDDFREASQTVAIVKAALSNPKLIAMVGLNISSNAKAVVETIGQSGVPLL